ncbi:MAG TPA: type IV secretion system DNA-binding domain-containing protein [bacterium]|nr:type IV secretion system DNA-binding domain-containing protein [bacterium]
MTPEQIAQAQIDWNEALGKIPGYTALVRFFHSIPYEEIIHGFVVLLIVLFALWLLLRAYFKLMRAWSQSKQKFVFLEITPPQSTDIPSVTTTGLFNLIAGLLNNSDWLDRLLFRHPTYSFEIVSGKESGIRYLVRVPEDVADALEKNLRTYLPGNAVKTVSDYLSADLPKSQNVKVIEFKFGRHFAYPLNEQSDLNKHDPLAYLTSSMTQLKSGNILALQVILEPLNSLELSSVRREIAQIKALIRKDKFAHWLHDWGFRRRLRIVNDLAFSFSQETTSLISEVVTGKGTKPLKSEPFKITATSADKELEEIVKTKLEQPLFAGSIRALLVMDKSEMKTREQGFRSSFMSFVHPAGQSLIPRRRLSAAKLAWRQYKNRLLGSPLVLSSSEVGSLYHFPQTTNNMIEDLVRTRSRELPAPLSLKQSDQKLDVVIGVNRYGNEDIPVGLTLEQRQKHMYVIGKTGMGKTTMLTNAIYQDMKNGKGLAVFDPHGDMFQELLKIVPENRKDDVIVFDPSDREWPIGLNILSPGVNFTNEEDEQEWIASSVIAVFAKITAKEYWGPRMEHILRNATLTALQTENPSLYTLQRLLTDKQYQKEVAGTLKDPVLKQFWKKEFALLGKMQLSSVTAPLTQRLGSFITTKMSRHILLQEKSTISISQIMDEGKILLVNLSKGDLGEDMSFFFGVILTSFIWMAAYQRTKIPEKDRRDFFLYVDEFQNFATPRFSEITSEGRKFHVSLIASHQNVAQIEEQSILKIVAGNSSSIVCLKAGPDDENFILPFMAPEVKKGDIVNLPPYHFFMKTTNAVSEGAFSGQTLPQEAKGSEEIKNMVVRSSRINNATPREDVEEYLEKLFSGRFAEKQTAKKAARKSVKKATDAVLKTKEKTSHKVADNFLNLP